MKPLYAVATVKKLSDGRDSPLEIYSEKIHGTLEAWIPISTDPNKIRDYPNYGVGERAASRVIDVTVLIERGILGSQQYRSIDKRV